MSVSIDVDMQRVVFEKELLEFLNTKFTGKKLHDHVTAHILASWPKEHRERIVTPTMIRDAILEWYEKYTIEQQLVVERDPHKRDGVIIKLPEYKLKP
jgi:hypothetical protein